MLCTNNFIEFRFMKMELQPHFHEKFIFRRFFQNENEKNEKKME